MSKSFYFLSFSLLVFLAALHPAHAGPNDPVNIPDAALRRVIEASLSPPKNLNAPITEADMATLEPVKAGNSDIRELTGLEYAINLKILTFTRVIPQTRAELFARPFWRKADIEFLSKLTKLERLKFQGVVIFDITPIVNLTNLKDLGFLFTYGITQIPDLSKLTSLVHLRLTRNEITDISGVRGLTNLRELELASNPNLSDISPLTQLRNLEILRLDGTAITRESLSAVLPFMSTEIDQELIEETPVTIINSIPQASTAINSGQLGFGNTNISDLSVLDRLPNVFLYSLYLRHMGTLSSETFCFHLTDLTPLVALMNKGKVINHRTNIHLAHNYGLDYTSLYEDLPALIAGSRDVEYYKGSVPTLEIEPPPPPMVEIDLQEKTEAIYRGHPRSRYTFKVRAVNTNPTFPASWVPFTPHKTGDNRQFANAPVTFTVTNPDGTTETQGPVLTGNDGLAPVHITLGNDGETHTVVAVVPAKTTSVTEIQHPELRVRFTVRADRNVPPPPRIGGGGGGHSLSHLAFPGEVSFSELMFATDGGANSLPQWIEVCNASETRTLNLHGWRLEVEGRDSEGEYRYESITLRDLPIPPRQTALLVTSDAENTVELPKEQIYNLADHHPLLFRRNSTAAHENKVLGETGLFLKLLDPYGSVSDVAGNLDGDRRTKDEPAWTLPDGMTDLGTRTSLMRLYDAQGIPLDGSLRDTYVRAADLVLEVESYYGTATDVGNPGYKNGWAFPPGPPERLYFSELMLTSKGGLHSLPQWIELYNASETEVDLRDYQLKIETLDTSGQRRHAVIKLAGFLIPPGQTAVLVSQIGRSSRSIRPYVQHFAMQGKRHRDRNTVFSQTGFFLKLSDPDGRIHDIAGNLDGIQGTADAPRWELPVGMTPDGARTSLIRRYYRAAGIPLDGKSEENWIPASELPLEVMTYYGHSTDIGNPGYVNDARRIRGPAVSFSELMFTESRGRRSLPAWIEVYNGSENAVDLRDYQLEIEARDANAEHRHDVITFQGFSIPAHQTAVLVTSGGRHSPDLPQDRIYALYRRMPAAFRQVPNQILGESGFFLKLSDPEGQVSDVVGNLDGNKRTKDPPTWQRPTGQTTSGTRVSLMRRYHEIGMPFDGRASENWGTASEMRLEVSSYYGKETDIGNPGYTNQQRGIPGHQVSFSELMLTSRGGLHSLPQWIELYNDSETEVDLRDWQLHIEARDAAGEHRHGIITLKNLLIPANQTALIVTRPGRSSREILRETVYNISVQKAFDRNAVLGQSGFFLKLLDPEGQVSDTAGNLDGDRRTQDTPAWQLPTGKTEEGHRISLMRRYYHVTGIPLNGSISENWVPASQLPLQVMTYWGKETDIGNPGHRGGGPLPVRLSRFHPVRDKATGHVKITWVTASEMNNAGFNILRSETKSGEFKVINAKGLIAGHGTTNEKHVYTFTDTTAKPNVVYYYRLEDVSLAGQQTPLATTHVRGNVVAAGKLMTLWGDLKKSR